MHATFWPRLPHADLSGREIEPDVVWEHDAGVLVVEAKWNATQDPDQIEREYRAVARSHPGRSVTMLALGGIRPGVLRRLSDTCSAQTILALSWERLADELRGLLRQEPAGPGQQVLSDLVAILEWRGLRGIEHLKMLQTLPYCDLPEILSWSLDFSEPNALPRRKFSDLVAFSNLNEHALRGWSLA